MGFQNCLVTCIISLVLIESSAAASILLVTGSHQSHCREVGVIGAELLRRGHGVTIFIKEDVDPMTCVDHSKIKSITYPGMYENLDQEIARQLTDDKFRDSFPELSRFKNVSQTMCTDIFRDGASLKKLHTEKYDIAIVAGALMLRCLLAIPFKLGIPHVLVGSHIEPVHSGQVFDPHMVPYTLFPDTACDVSLKGRLLSTIMWLMLGLLNNAIGIADATTTYAPELTVTRFDELFLNSELFIENSDPLISCPKPLLPNFIQTGGLSATLPNPLPSNFEEFYRDATEGVIVVSFGSAINYLPDETIDKLLNSFERLPNIKILFRWKDNIDAPPNVKIVKWLPQNDLLGQTKTRLLIYHCGNNGVMEAVFHGVPTICLPVFADQPYNSVLVRDRGLGLLLDIRTFTVDELVSSINDVLHNSTYKDAGKRLSAIFRSRSETPVHRAANAVEHVIQFGGAHLRSPGSYLPLVQHLQLDIWCIIFGLPLLILFIIIKLLLKIIRWCRKTKHSEKMKTQ